MSGARKKIVLATPLYPPEIGGPATYSALLMAELPSRGIDIVLVKFGDTRRFPKGLSHLVYFLKLIKASRGADLIYALDPVSVGLPSLLAAKFTGKPLVVKIVGDYAWEQGRQRFGVEDMLDAFVLEYKRYPWPVRLLKQAQTFVARHADRIIVPSKYLAGIVQKWGMKEPKITVVYNAFQVEYEPVSKKELRLLLNLSGKVIVSAGRLVPWKGFETLLAVVAALRERHPDINLVIVGDGPEQQNLKLKIKEKSLDKHVRLTGRLSHQELLKYCKAADIFALNTGYEGFSHQLLEVMALGLPVVTTNVGGNGELIDHGRSGLLVAYNDVAAFEKYIDILLANPDEATRLGVNAKERVATFNEVSLLDNTIKVLRSI